MDSVWEIGVEIIRNIQSWGTGLLVPMQCFTALGKAEFYLLMMCVLYWCLDKRLGMSVAALLLISGTLNESLKVFFHQPRPYWLSTQVHAWTSEETFGLPSGHAQLSYSVWGYIATTPRRRRAIIGALLLSLIIGFSRIYLGVHLPTDVLVGWILGGLVLWVFLRCEPRARRWWRDHSPSERALAVIGSAYLLWLLPTIAIGSIADRAWEVPLAWQQNALASSGHGIDPAHSLDPGRLPGLFLGSFGGVIWLSLCGGFDVRGRLLQRALRLVVGLIGVALIYVAMPKQMPWVGSLAVLRYALIGFWIAGLAPALFVRIGLASKANGD